MKKWILVAALFFGCQSKEQADAVSMANPASVYCASLEGESEMKTDDQGNQFSLCHLPDGLVIEEWELYRRDHPEEK